MKKFEMLRINDSLVKAMNYKNHEFAYAVLKNKQIVEDFLQELNFFNDVPEKYVEYENKRVDLCKRTCKKDENGMDIVMNGRYEITDQETFKNEMQALATEYGDEIKLRDEQIEKLNNILQEDMTSIPTFIKVKKEDIPTDIKTAAELYEFAFMID